MTIDRVKCALLALCVLGASLLAGCAATRPQTGGGARAQDLAKIEHIVVIYAENHSFDNMYGLFPGANGIANATAEQKTQLDQMRQQFKSDHGNFKGHRGERREAPKQ